MNRIYLIIITALLLIFTSCADGIIYNADLVCESISDVSNEKEMNTGAYITGETGEITESSTECDTAEETTEYITKEELTETVEPSTYIGGPLPCSHSLKVGGIEIENSYHGISGAFIDYIGQERFQNWISDYEDDTEKINIAQFVNDFSIQRNVFDFIYNYDGGTKYQVDYNTDAIYNDQCDEYYSEDNLDERLNTYLTGYYLSCLKANLINYVANNMHDKYSDWCADNDKSKKWCILPIPEGISEEFMRFSGQISRWNISEFINEFDLNEETVRSLEARFSGNADTGYTLEYTKLYNDIHSGIFNSDSEYLIYIGQMEADSAASYDIGIAEALPLVPDAEPALLVPSQP